jgi:hypothetical protein
MRALRWTGWLVLAVLSLSVTYGLLVFAGH